MAQILNNFILNSDYTAEKKLTGVYKVSIDVPQLTLGQYTSRNYSTNIAVPEGSHLELAGIKNTLVNDYWAPGLQQNINYYDSNWNTASIYATLYQYSNTEYKLQVCVTTSYNSGNITVPSCTVSAKLHLSVSPFD